MVVRAGLMMSESMDRKGTFSFRCVADAVVPYTCPWQLCGTVTDQAPGLIVDLTTLGSEDWVHWGRETALDLDYMLRPSPEGGALPPSIGATVLNHGMPSQPQRYTDDAFPGASLSFAWINGAVAERVPQTATGPYALPSLRAKACSCSHNRMTDRNVSGGAGIFVTKSSGLGGFRVTARTL